MPFRYARRVQFAETDQAGIVHFSWYFRYMEEAEHALWRAAGLSIADRDRAVVFPRVAASCDFLAPLRFEDEFEVDVAIASIGRRSIRYRCDITRGTIRIATGTMTVACATRGEQQPLRATDLPEDLVARLRPYEDTTGRRDGPVPAPLAGSSVLGTHD
jgi:4-hydroxybenzoyl-CoA thioesterase/acyl-CoA thioester hydrolase